MKLGYRNPTGFRRWGKAAKSKNKSDKRQRRISHADGAVKAGSAWDIVMSGMQDFKRYCLNHLQTIAAVDRSLHLQQIHRKKIHWQ